MKRPLTLMSRLPAALLSLHLDSRHHVDERATHNLPHRTFNS